MKDDNTIDIEGLMCSNPQGIRIKVHPEKVLSYKVRKDGVVFVKFVTRCYRNRYCGWDGQIDKVHWAVKAKDHWFTDVTRRDALEQVGNWCEVHKSSRFVCKCPKGR